MLFRSIRNVVNKMLASVSVFLFSLLVFVVTWQVFSRYVLKNPSGFTEELAKILFVWLVLISAAYLFGERGGHMNIGIINEKVSQKTAIILDLVGQIAICIFALFVLVMGGYRAVLNGLGQSNAGIPFISTGQIYAAIPICGIFTVFFTICFLIEDIDRLTKGEKLS